MHLSIEKTLKYTVNTLTLEDLNCISPKVSVLYSHKVAMQNYLYFGELLSLLLSCLVYEESIILGFNGIYVCHECTFQPETPTLERLKKRAFVTPIS